MHINHSPPGSSTLLPTAVEVEIWEGYILRNQTSIGKTLCTYSLDNGPLQETARGTLIFRFTIFDWQKNVRELLSRNNVHFDELRCVHIDALHQLPRKKIYIAEDDPDILFTLSRMLEEAGYQVRVASSGAPILSGNYSWVDLFILDNAMPDIDGLEICRHLRSQNATKDTPVIVISAQPKAASEAIEAGVNDYIEKPFEMHYLLNLVSRLVKRPG